MLNVLKYHPCTFDKTNYCRERKPDDFIWSFFAFSSKTFFTLVLLLNIMPKRRLFRRLGCIYGLKSPSIPYRSVLPVFHSVRGFSDENRNEGFDPDLDESKFDFHRKEEMRQKQALYHQKAMNKHKEYINKMEFEMKINEEWEKQREKEKERKDFQEFTFTVSDSDFPQTKEDQKLKYAVMVGVGVLGCVLLKKLKG